MEISEAVKKRLCILAQKYETADFYKNDPSMILHRYENSSDTEIAAFIMALLSFGRRDLFLRKARLIFDMAGHHPAAWIQSGQWRSDFPSGASKFYRFYSYDDMRNVFINLQSILQRGASLGEYIKALYEAECGKCNSPAEQAPYVPEVQNSSVHLDCVISSVFENCRAVPRAAQSANKRINMFLRWMVRNGSPVDAGLWTWFSPRNLIIPLDTHVLQESINLGLIPQNSKGTRKTAVAITAALQQIWPDDPCRGDFALFGLGVSEN